MKKMFVATISLILFLLCSCTSGKATPEPGIECSMDYVDSGDYDTLTADVDRDTVMTFGSLSLQLADYGKLVHINDDIYASIHVYAIPSAPATIKFIAQGIDSAYIGVTDQHLTLPEASTLAALKDNINALCTNFTDSVAPLALTSDDPIRAFSFETTYRVNFAFGEYVTYGVFTMYYTGGAHPLHDFRYYTTNINDGTPLTFNDLIKEKDRPAVRKALLETMAQAHQQTVEQYLATVNEFLANSPEEAYTIENFPIYNVAINRQGLVFCYPIYSIAPYCDGQGIYALPIESIRPSLTIKI